MSNAVAPYGVAGIFILMGLGFLAFGWICDKLFDIF
jgi:hypothetical protein